MTFQNNIMKKLILTGLAIFLMMSTIPSQAQPEYTIPNSNFEQWTKHPGYTVSILFSSYPVFNDYYTPTSWDYPTMPVHESVEYSGIIINIDTELPLSKISTYNDGDKALSLTTCQISDIIITSTYNIIKKYIDSIYVATTFPSILSLGKISPDNFLDMLDIISEYEPYPGPMLATFDEQGISQYMTKGLALKWHLPSSLSGQYIYKAASADDHGGILLIGTRYDQQNNRTQVVGGGFGALNAQGNAYQTFNVEYQSMHYYNDEYEEIAPDTLLVLLMSSAGENKAHGSELILDDLHLYTAVGSGIAEHETSPWHIYPNPTTDILRCTANEPITSLTLYDLSGRKLMETHDNQLSLSTLAAGMYVVEVNHMHREMVVKR